MMPLQMKTVMSPTPYPLRSQMGRLVTEFILEQRNFSIHGKIICKGGKPGAKTPHENTAKKDVTKFAPSERNYNSACPWRKALFALNCVLVATSHRDLGKVVTHKVRDRAS
jgi:hypothetical protein